MDLHYNQSYTKDQIQTILDMIQNCIRNDLFTISLNENRQENIEFFNTYQLTSRKQKAILLSIKVEDFCHSLNNMKTGYEHEILYVFSPQVLLYNIEDVAEVVNVYIKFNMIEKSDRAWVIVVSFHRRNKSIEYVFK